MVLPPLTTWMEELDDFLRLGIDTGEIGAFVKVAVDTCESEILDIVGAAMLFGNDVLDVESSER